MNLLPVPILSYAFSSCDLLQTYPSIGSVDIGPLVSQYPEYSYCSVSGGLGVDVGAVPEWSFSCCDDDVDSAHEEQFSDLFFESQSSMAGLQDYFLKQDTTTGWALATWIVPDITASSLYDQPIVSFAKSRQVDDDAAVVGGCEDYDFQISISGYFGLSLKTCFTIGQGSARECHCVSSDDIEGMHQQVTTHLAVVFKPQGTWLFVNGRMSTTSMLGPTWREWDYMNETSLQVLGFRKDLGRSVFSGTIHQLDIYDESLQLFQVNEMFKQGMPLAQVDDMEVVAKVDRVVLGQNTTKQTTIRLGSNYKSSHPVLNLAIEILSLPQHGVLTMNSVPLNVKRLIPFSPGAFFVEVQYMLHANSSNYFNVPTLNYRNESTFSPESFDFRVVASDFTGAKVTKSPTSTQWISVMHHGNHEGILTAPSQAFRSENDPQLATFGLIDYDDVLDRDIDRVAVNLKAQFGSLTIHETHRHLADFESCRHRVPAEKDESFWWTCVGDGVDDGEMTFLAIPSDVRLILQGLTHYSNTSGFAWDDTVRISIRDGIRGVCLSEAEHRQSTDLYGMIVPRNSIACFVVGAIIRVPGYTDPARPMDVDDDGYWARYFRPTAAPSADGDDGRDDNGLLTERQMYRSTCALIPIMICMAVYIHCCERRRRAGATVVKASDESTVEASDGSLQTKPEDAV